jgi:hypothetical protein
VADWVTISSLATGAGTLVLAVATFSSVRSANRSARVAERALHVGQRPLLIPSREEDPVERIRFGDNHILTVSGHGGAVEAEAGIIYMALALRNGGAGLAVLHAWRPRVNRDRDELRATQGDGSPEQEPDLTEFRRQQLDLYIPAGDTGYWQGAMRDPSEAGYPEVLDAVSRDGIVQVDLLYGDLEGGQRTIARFIISPWPEVEGERAIAVRYWNLDDTDPRQS